MNKQDFIAGLREKLSGLPKQDVEERLTFYSEIIDDRVEEGLSEEEAVREIGSVDAVASQIVAEIPLLKLAKNKIKPKRQLKAWEIVLLALGSPIWLSLAFSAFAVILSLYVVLWSAIISLWAIFGSFVGCTLGGVIAGIGFTLAGNGLAGIATIGTSLLCAGLSMFLFSGCLSATKGILLFTKKIASGIKNWFIKKEEA